MKRREFITLLGGAAAAWPLAARAQQPDRMRRVGVLTYLAADDPEGQVRLAAFAQALAQLGWTVGAKPADRTSLGCGRCRTHSQIRQQNWSRWPLTSYWPRRISRSRRCCRRPALSRLCSCRSCDPVGGGFVDSLARPGGNATGFTLFEYSMSGKWLELLKEIAPGVSGWRLLGTPREAAGIGQFAVIQAVAPSRG